VTSSRGSFARQHPVLFRVLPCIAVVIAALAIFLSPALMNAAQATAAGLKRAKSIGVPSLTVAAIVVLVGVIAFVKPLSSRTRHTIRREKLRTGPDHLSTPSRRDQS